MFLLLQRLSLSLLYPGFEVFPLWTRLSLFYLILLPPNTGGVVRFTALMGSSLVKHQSGRTRKNQRVPGQRSEEGEQGRPDSLNSHLIMQGPANIF